MRNSEIFDAFVKIAQEKGMISNDSSDAKKQLEKTHRADSLSITDIEALYNVKPDASKGMEYERNIIENAHPNSVVVSPSYDKLNGLVENNNERQDILLHIVNKTPDGLQTQRKYATQDLLMTLVRVANDLDNQNEEELRVLADTCLLQASEKKKLTKTAALPIVLLIGAATILSGLYIKNHMRFVSEGFQRDHDKLISEIDDMLNSTSSWGVGYQYKPELLSMLNNLKSKLISFYNSERKIEPILTTLEKPEDPKALIEQVKEPETDSVVKAIEELKTAYTEIATYISTVEKDFSSEFYKQRQVADKGWITSLIDKTQVLHGGSGLIADDFDDVVHAIGAYKKSIQELGKVLRNAESMKQAALKKLQAANMETQEIFGPEKSGVGGQAGKTVQDLDQEASNLESELGGFIPGLT